MIELREISADEENPYEIQVIEDNVLLSTISLDNTFSDIMTLFEILGFSFQAYNQDDKCVYEYYSSDDYEDYVEQYGDEEVETLDEFLEKEGKKE